ncbi:MAG: type I restriction enzyme HsdR N-terminal domain-containing protein [Thermodesulfobacteriota bacterium]
MHEISLGQTLTDYLSGQPIEATTYEDIRQALTRMLVEEKGYPPSQLHPKVPIAFVVDGQDFEHRVDLVALDPRGTAVAVIMFCAGDVVSYIRETVAAARLVPQGPAPLAMITDTQSAVCVCSADGSVQYEGGYHALPTWEALLDLAQQCPPGELSEASRTKEQRLLYTFRGLTGCCSGSCADS